MIPIDITYIFCERTSAESFAWFQYVMKDNSPILNSSWAWIKSVYLNCYWTVSLFFYKNQRRGIFSLDPLDATRAKWVLSKYQI